MRTWLLSVIAVAPVTATALAGHERVSLDERVRLADLIAIATVVEVEAAPDACPVPLPATTAKHVTIFRLDRVLKGSAELKTVRLPFDTDYKYEKYRSALTYDEAPETLGAYRRGEQYLLFLRKLSADFYAPVNWAYGVVEVVDQMVTDPACPSFKSTQTYRRNVSCWNSGETLRAFGGTGEPSDYSKSVPIKDASDTILTAVEVAGSETRLGKLYLDECYAPMLLTRSGGERRVVIRTAFRANRPPIAPDGLKVSIVTKDGATVRLPSSARASRVPPSVDPLNVTSDAAFTLPVDVETEQLVAVKVRAQARTQTVCVPGRPSDGFRTDSRAKECPACGSWESRRIVKHPPPSFGAAGCAFSHLAEVKYGKGTPPNARRHCATCGTDW